MGISFSGGLSIVAAGAAVAQRTRGATSSRFGGHDDLPRVLPYLCTGRRAEPPRRAGPSSRSPPHDYGVAVILLAIADRVVPAEQVGAAARGRAAVPLARPRSTSASTSRARRREFAALSGRRADRCRSRRGRCSATSTIATSRTSARGCCRSSATTAATRRCRRRSRRSRRRRCSCCTASTTTSCRCGIAVSSPRICAATRACAAAPERSHLARGGRPPDARPGRLAARELLGRSAREVRFDADCRLQIEN